MAAARAKAKEADAPLVLRINAAEFGAGLVEDLKSVFGSFPGECEVVLEMGTREGTRRLRFGPEIQGQRIGRAVAEIDQLLGPAAIAA